MNKIEVLQLIENGENSGVEFKRDTIRPEQLAKEAVAFANAYGGRIFLGIEDDGTLSGMQRPHLQKWVFNAFRDKIHPQIIPFYEEIQIDDTIQVAVVTIGQGISKPYVVRHNGRVMRDFKYADSRGMGIRTKVIPLMRSRNGCDPLFEATDDYVKVVLPRKKSQ